MSLRERFGRHQKRVGPGPQKIDKCCIQLFKIAGTNDVQHNVGLISRDFGLTNACSHARVRRIPKDRHPRNHGSQRAQHFQAFRAQVRRHQGAAG